MIVEGEARTRTSRTDDLRAFAPRYLVGGVSSSFRLNPFTGLPLYASHAAGPYIHDSEGRRSIDFFMGHGPCPLGHNRDEVVNAVRESLACGLFAKLDQPMTKRLFARCIEEGLYFHTDFTVSAQHTEPALDEALSIVARVLETMPRGLMLPGFWSEFGMCTEPPAFGSLPVWGEDEFPFANPRRVRRRRD